MNLKNIVPPGISKDALWLGVVAFTLFLAVSVNAQQPVASPASPPAAKTSAAEAKSELKTGLSELSTLYQNEVQRLEKQQQTSKELYDDGLISRLEFEKGEKALADARAKVEDVARQIAAANQPASVLTADVGAAMDSPSNIAWTTGNSRIDGLIRQYGTQYGVDPYLIYCLMSQESSFVSSATSYKGAQGLMQLMPGTAARYGVTNPYDVAQNIKGGTRYLKDLLKMFNGRVDLALAGYNAGEGAVMKYGNTIPPYNETRNYVRVILKRYTKKSTS
ncbi:MAG: lytic transglycosylase domain-containing protein [Acidobacteria bacterium]|nr:lytic transglycosylase domain-containing protein [Acidobacteriota bacterium]